MWANTCDLKQPTQLRRRARRGKKEKRNQSHPKEWYSIQRNIICGAQWASCSIVKMSASTGKCVYVCVWGSERGRKWERQERERERNVKHQQQHSSLFLPSLQSFYCLVFFCEALLFWRDCVWLACGMEVLCDLIPPNKSLMQQLAPFVSETRWDELLSINKQMENSSVLLNWEIQQIHKPSFQIHLSGNRKFTLHKTPTSK